MCVCVCVCIREGGREWSAHIYLFIYTPTYTHTHTCIQMVTRGGKQYIIGLPIDTPVVVVDEKMNALEMGFDTRLPKMLPTVSVCVYVCVCVCFVHV